MFYPPATIKWVHDFLFGDYEDDFIHGGEGFDQLYGGHGSDTLTGGTGGDAFNFFDSVWGGGFDTITDFEFGADYLVFSSAVQTTSSPINQAQTLLLPWLRTTHTG